MTSHEGATPSAAVRVRRSRGTERRSARWLAGDLLVSASTLLVVLAAASTLPRLFVEDFYSRPMILVGGLAWTFAVLARFARMPFFVAPVASGAVVGVYASRLCFPDLVTSASPAALPVRALVDAIRFDWSQLSATKAPVLGRPGFALSAILGVWLISVLTDLLAFTLRSPIEAIVPSAVLVLVGSVVAPPEGRATAATVYCAAAIFHVGAVTAASHRKARWTDGRAPSLAPQLLRITAITALAAFVTAVVVPRSGLTDRDGMVDWRSANDRRLPSSVTSPMVSLKRQLLDLPNAVMFTATSVSTATGTPVRTYWRLSTLTKFNGTTWSSTGSYRSIDRRTSLPPGESGGDPETVSRVTIDELRSSWLPTSYQAQRLDGTTLDPTIGLGYDARGDAVLSSRSTRAGDSYGLESVTATFDASGGIRLRDSGTSDRDLALPADFPADVATLARQITGGPGADDAPTRLAQLRSLQGFFRTEFVYSTAVPPPSRNRDLEDFVLRDRAGYCEQFSGAFAAMARSLGIPARVVVGFSPGRLTSGGQFVITGKNSHAWPEAYVNGIGWLAFEPTPGRGIPGAENYTGVPDQDASEGRAPAPPVTIPATTIPSATPTPTTPPATAEPPPPVKSTGRRLPPNLAPVLGLLLVVGSVALVVRQRRRRRDPVEHAWSAVVRDVARTGIVREHHESDRAFAERASGAISSDASMILRELAARVEAHRFAPEEQWTPADTAAFLAEVARFRSGGRTPSSRR